MATLAAKAAAAPLAARRPTVAAPQYEYSYPYGPTGPAFKRLVGSAPTGAADKYTQDKLAGKYGLATQQDEMKRQAAPWGPQGGAVPAPGPAPVPSPVPQIGQPASGSSGGLPIMGGAKDVGGPPVSFGDKTSQYVTPPGTAIIPTKPPVAKPGLAPAAAPAFTPPPVAAPVRPAWRDRVPSALNSAMERNLPGGVNQ